MEEKVDRAPAYFAVIPSTVRYDKTLRPNAKLLYAEISALADYAGYCWATNKYLAGLFGLSDKTISDLVSTLADKKYVRVEVIRDAATQSVTERRIWIAHRGADLPLPTPPPKIKGR
ncbi:MAG: helix-turn-helix domain-containing protein, partial [Oscillospiraceae bacterium]